MRDMLNSFHFVVKATRPSREAKQVGIGNISREDLRHVAYPHGLKRKKRFRTTEPRQYLMPVVSKSKPRRALP